MDEWGREKWVNKTKKKGRGGGGEVASGQLASACLVNLLEMIKVEHVTFLLVGIFHRTDLLRVIYLSTDCLSGKSP